MAEFEIPTRVATLLSDPRATVLALDPTGSQKVSLPSELRGSAAQPIGPDNAPMDALDPRSMGRAVSLFELARRNSASEGAVTLVDGQSAMLHLFDLSDQLGVFLGFLVPQDCAPSAGGHAPLLTPRQITSRVTPNGLFVMIDRAHVRVLGWEPAELVGTSALELTHPEDHERGIVTWAELLDDPGGARRLRVRLQHKAGHWIWFETTSHNLLADDESCILNHSVDISDEMAAVTALHNREALLARLTEALPSGVLHLDHELSVLFSNPRWFEITGLAPGSSFRALAGVVENPEALQSAVNTALRDNVDVDLDITFTNGETLGHGRLSMRPIIDRGIDEGVLLSLEDTTDARLLQARLVDEARTDPLTGLLNRAGIVDELDRALNQTSTTTPTVAALYIDLDRFKLINDEHSHALGDDVLCMVAEKLSEMVRPGDHVGRLGGDEFLMILSEVGRPDDAYAIALRLETEIESVSTLWGNGISVAGSVGVALARPAEGTGELLSRADAKMYERKADRRSMHRMSAPGG